MEMSSLTFERLNPEGNSPDAVVYMEEESLLLYKGTHYKMLNKFPDDTGFTDIHLMSGNRMFVKGRSEKFQKNVVEICKSTVVPDTEQKTKLTALFQKHGRVMADEAKQMLEWIDRTKTRIKEHLKEIDAICPGLDPNTIHTDCEFYTDAFQEDSVDKFRDDVDNLFVSSTCLAEAEPFTRKRKAGGV